MNKRNADVVRIVRCEPGYDCLKFECRRGNKDCRPGSNGSHGRNGLSIRFAVKGEQGAVQFLVQTGWFPQFASQGTIGRHIEDWGCDTLPVDLGYHSKAPRYDGQTPMDKCEFTDGPCYYDGSSLNATDAMYALVNGGDKALWQFLDAYYEHVFYGGPYPDPAEYPTPPRRVQ